MKATVRRKYKPRKADPGALERVIARLQLFTPVELRTLQTPVRVAFESLRTGDGQEADFHTLAAAMNTALVRSESIDPQCVEVCQLAQDALMRVLGRSKRLRKWGLDAAGLQDIPPAIDLFEQILTLSTPLQMQQSMRETMHRMQAGHGLEIPT